MDKLFKNLKFENSVEKKAKGFTQKSADIVSTNKKPINLKTVKAMAKVFDVESEKKDRPYVIMGRNQYNNYVTIRSDDGSYYDDDPDYYKNRRYDKSIFENFEMIQIIYYY